MRVTDLDLFCSNKKAHSSWQTSDYAYAIWPSEEKSSALALQQARADPFPPDIVRNAEL